MPNLTWDESTAYDLFVSLYVLHRPEQFGLRASWAAGVRSRIPISQREFLESAQTFLPVPLRWLYLLPAGSRNAAGAIHALAQLSIEERLPSLSLTPQSSPLLTSTLRHITLRQTWNPAELEVLRKHFQRKGLILKPAGLQHLCQAWAHPAEFGERFLQALGSYYQAFFAEEEERIRPALRTGLDRAAEMAAGMETAALLDALTGGLHFAALDSLRKVVLAPSFWAGPLAFFQRIQPASLIVAFGCRDNKSSLVPGEDISDQLIGALKAVSDPTRLRILRYLAGCPQTPSQLARLLRLRAPTVIHHLNTLRAAGLVEITLQPEMERSYTLRGDALNGVLEGLRYYLEP